MRSETTLDFQSPCALRRIDKNVMPGAVETEIKLAATPAMLEALRTHPILSGSGSTTELITTYFDTRSGRLRLGGAALRIRHGGKRREQTFKLAGAGEAVIRRSEWSLPAVGDLPDPSGFPAKARSILTRLLDGEIPQPVATVRIDRETRRLRHRGSSIEIAFDKGAVEAGDRKEAVCELELELIKGRVTDVIELALNLPLGPELGWSVMSKGARCHALAFDIPAIAAHAQTPKITAGMNVAEGFQAIAWNCLGQLLANYPLVVASAAPQAVHQCRVAIRRLRTACGLFRDVADDDTAPILRAELKALAASLGPARDLHVLTSQIVSTAKAEDQDILELLAYLDTLQDDANRSVQAMLAAAPFKRLLFRIAAWIEGGEWLARQNENGGERSLALFARRALTRRRRKLRRESRGFVEMSDSARHQLRIGARKLRYIVGFFAPLYHDNSMSEQRSDFLKALGEIQDRLGELNDMAVAAAGREALFTRLEPMTAARLNAQLAGLLDLRWRSRRRLMKIAEKSLSTANGLPAWWKADGAV